MKLNEPLENSFTLDGIEYDVDCAFDIILDVFDVFNDEVLNDIEKYRLAIEIVTGQRIEDIMTIFNVWEYIDEHFIKVQDAGDIYASFRMAYGINLFEEQGKLTWKEFSALLNGLPDNTPVAKLIQIRDWKPTKNDSAEYKSKMRKLQNKYRLDGEEV